MDKVADLQELVSLSEDKLEQVLGNSSNASLLWGFLHTKLGIKAKGMQKKSRPHV